MHVQLAQAIAASSIHSLCFPVVKFMQQTDNVKSLQPIIPRVYREILVVIYTVSQKRDPYTFAHNLAKY
jgi:hypothetical protein